MDSGTTVDKVIKSPALCSNHRIPLISPSFIDRIGRSRGAHPTQGENARLSSFVGAIAIADLVKTTLGPKGMDKILQRIGEHDKSVSVTNDGATSKCGTPSPGARANINPACSISHSLST